MKRKLEMLDIYIELRNLYNDLNREQCKLFTRAMALKTTMHEVKELVDTLKQQMEEKKD